MVLSDFDDEGFSAAVTFSSSMESAAEGVTAVPGSMKSWFVRGMVSGDDDGDDDDVGDLCSSVKPSCPSSWGWGVVGDMINDRRRFAG